MKTLVIINQAKKVFGYTQFDDDTISLTMLDIKTGEFTDLFHGELGYTIGVVEVSEQYVIYSYHKADGMLIEFYSMDLTSRNKNKFYEIKDLSTFTITHASIVGTHAYISLLDHTSEAKFQPYMLYDYDLEHNTMDVIEVTLDFLSLWRISFTI